MEANTGQFGIGLGGIQALKSAMQQRGMDASILDQVSPAAPSGPSQVAPPVPQTNPQVGAMPSATPQAGPTPTGPTAPPSRTGEMDIALKALAGTVRTENKIAESQLKLASPAPASI